MHKGNLMEEQRVERKPRTWLRKIGHGLAILCFGGWFAYVAGGLMYGFSTVPTSFGSAALVWAQWTGYALIAAFISLIVLAVSKPSTAWITFFLLATGTAYLMKPEGNTAQPTAHRASAVSPTSAENQLTVAEIIQSSQGVAESDIGPEFIAGIEQFLLKDKQAQYERVMRSVGKEPTPDALVAGSQLVREGPYRLVVTQISHKAIEKGGPTIKIAWWIQGDQLKLVQCVDTSGAPIALQAGKCGHQIADTFGFSDWLINQ